MLVVRRQESSFTGFAVVTGNRLLRGGCSHEIRVKWRVALVTNAAVASQYHHALVWHMMNVTREDENLLTRSHPRTVMCSCDCSAACRSKRDN